MNDDNTVLIVDDNPDNLSVLFDYLQAAHFKVLIAEDGEGALKRVQHLKPDIILLDVMMPGIDGFETCRQFKNNYQTTDIPVIFMTALSDTSNKVQAFELGAVDYITKPFQQEEVLARVNTHITISKLQKQLQAQNEQLIKLNQEKNEFLSIAAHDLKNPLSDIHMVIDFLKSYSDQVPEKVTKMLDLISISSKRMFDLIKDILDINAIEAGKMNLSIQFIDLHEIVQLLLIRYTYRTEKKNITLQLQSKLEQCLVFADYNCVCQVLDNLVSNAIKFSPNDKQVQIRLTQNDNYMCCEVQDEGPGLNAQDKQRLFGKFARAI